MAFDDDDDSDDGSEEMIREEKSLRGAARLKNMGLARDTRNFRGIMRLKNDQVLGPRDQRNLRGAVRLTQQQHPTANPRPLKNLLEDPVMREDIKKWLRDFRASMLASSADISSDKAAGSAPRPPMIAYKTTD